MADDTFTLLADGRVCETRATIAGDHVHLTPAALHAVLGWELKPQGLCKDDRCLPVRDRGGLMTPDGIDLAAFAALLARPLAIDFDAGG